MWSIIYFFPELTIWNMVTSSVWTSLETSTSRIMHTSSVRNFIFDLWASLAKIRGKSFILRLLVLFYEIIILKILNQPLVLYLGRNRWVIYNDKTGLEYDGSMVPAEWFGWLHYKTDLPPTIVKIMILKLSVIYVCFILVK